MHFDAFILYVFLLDERVIRKDYLWQNLIDRANRSQLNKVETSVLINSIKEIIEIIQNVWQRANGCCYVMPTMWG